MPYDNNIKVIDVLSEFKNENVFFNPLTGNNGDELISAGARYAIDQSGCKRVNDINEAKAIIVTGGAGLSSVWGGGYKQIEHYFTGDLAKVPLIILPSTISIETVDLPKLFSNRNARSWIFCRERTTLARMQAGEWAADVTIGLDHDMAFHLLNSDWLESQKAKCEENHVLIVERRDAEGLSGSRDKAVNVPNRLKSYVPSYLKILVKKRMHEKQRLKTPFTKWAKDLPGEHFSTGKNLPLKTIDISLKGVCSFDDFLSYIRKSESIVTTRLHVAIFSAMLGKKTIIVPGDVKYGKIQGIHEYSMSAMSNVVIVANKFATNANIDLNPD